MNLSALLAARASFLFYNGIAQHPDLFDFNLYEITFLQVLRRVHRHAYSLRRAGENNGSRIQRRTAAEKFYQSGNIKKHV